jgi:hypothetical protein
MTQEVKPQDHPDFVGGWVWTELESRWIEKRIAEAILAEREACAKVAENRILVETSKTEKVAYYTACKNIATEIRARGKA